jgi:DNA-binding winged helix-turn-helix (wHTH) protein
MTHGSFRFDRFELDPCERRLRSNDGPIELNARYLDALALLVREAGKLISKDRFLDEVWRGVPVTDEALTQCVKSLRRQLGDDAARPRFIETVPKHGYRFIAPVERIAPEPSASPVASTPSELPQARDDWRTLLMLGVAGIIGGGFAGMLGGLLYGFLGASQPLAPGMGAVSVLLVLVCLTILAGLIGGAGVGFGIAAANFGRNRAWYWNILGGAAGGLLVGAFAKLLGLDAFTLLVGRSPGNITGALEGAVLGGAVGFGAWLGARRKGVGYLRRSVAAAGVACGLAGVAITLLGGRLMGGSLDQLARRFPDSRLRLDQIGALFGEASFGPVSQAVTGGIEGMLFGAFVVGAMILARRSLLAAG